MFPTDLRTHLFYQLLFSRHCGPADAAKTFERVISEIGAGDADALRRRARELIRDGTAPSGGPALGPATGRKDVSEEERVYRALVMQAVFEGALDDSVVYDLINLAHKEALARRISTLLHNDEAEMREIREALDEFAELPLGESQVSEHLAIGIRVQLITFFVSDNLFYLGVAKNHITMRDIATLLKRCIGLYGRRSRIGGKSAGVILANSILRPAFGAPSGFEEKMGEIESHFLTAEAFHRFIELNGLEEVHGLKYVEGAQRERIARELEIRFLDGKFPEEIVEWLGGLVESVGEVPLIARSSSLLEDSMNFPFYGKYDSVFVANQGSLADRVEELTMAIKRVYVSILSSSVIEYRKDKSLLDYDDMMSVLIQPVVGQRWGKYYFPAVAGVAFSRNLFCWSRRIKAEDGVARIVYGLGTRAVDRSGDDYPRLMALGLPNLRPEGAVEAQIKYSQRYVDVLNLESRQVETVHFVDLYNEIQATGGSGYRPDHAVSFVSGDGGKRFEMPLQFPAQIRYGEAAITFAGLAEQGELPRLLKGALTLLEEKFGVPVDVEFACAGGKLYVLQCRPLVDGAVGSPEVHVPEPGPGDRVFFRANRDIFRSAAVEDLSHIVYVDGAAYNALTSPADKAEVARLVGRVNRALDKKRFMILGPGRWGSTNPELGVKVGYGDINRARVLAEIAFSDGSIAPELSYGTHFFQDLVEADIVPLALYPESNAGPEDNNFLDLALLDAAPSILEEVVADVGPEPVSSAVRVVDLEKVVGAKLSIYVDQSKNRGIGILR